ncbi:hypothetical protein C5D34_16535, partial [Rathayibacter sp. AY1B1]
TTAIPVLAFQGGFDTTQIGALFAALGRAPRSAGRRPSGDVACGDARGPPWSEGRRVLFACRPLPARRSARTMEQ